MLNRNGKAYLYPTMAIDTSQPALKVRSTGDHESVFNREQSSKIWVKGGTGNTTPSADDIDLYEAVSTLTEIDNTNTQKQSTRSYEENFIMTVTTTYQNNTGIDITIKELGMFIHESRDDRDIMIARQLVDPVVVRAGRSYAFTMTIG